MKSRFASGKSATKFLCVKTVRDKVARHLLAYVSMQKLLVGDVALYEKIWRILTHPLQNAVFQFTFVPSASAVRSSQKISQL